MILLMVQTITLCNQRIAKMYEQLGLTQDDIFHKTKLLLSIYRDVVWATLADCNCVNEEIYYYGDDLTDALAYLEEFAPDIERSEFERRVCNLFENKWMISQRTSGRSSRTLSLLSLTRILGKGCRNFESIVSVRQQQAGQVCSPAKCSALIAAQSSISALPRV